MPVVSLNEKLIERIRDGDGTAFEHLMQRYEGKVYRLALGMMKNREDALEAVQDAFLNVYRKIDTFKGNSAFSTWLYRIALNSVYMKLRSRSRYDAKMEPLESVEGSFDRAIEGFPAQKGDWSERADDAVLRRELGSVVKDAVAAMPEEYRAIFTLRDVDGLPNQEVAEILGLTVAATKTRLHRARIFLRERISRYLQGGSS